MKKHHMKEEMHHAHHDHHMGHKGKKSSHATYEHEVEKPHVPSVRKNEPMEPVDDFKGDAMDTAYGQAGEAGCRSDQKKIHGQFKNYGWDANTGY